MCSEISLARVFHEKLLSHGMSLVFSVPLSDLMNFNTIYIYSSFGTLMMKQERVQHLVALYRLSEFAQFIKKPFSWKLVSI